MKTAHALLAFSSLGLFNMALGNSVTLASGEWEPYQGENLPNGGPAALVISEAFAASGWSVSLEYLPWARGLEATGEAQFDGTFLYSFNEERAASFYYSEPVITFDTVVFYHPDSPISWEQESDLLGKNLGAVIAYDYGFAREEDGFTLDRIGQPENNFRKLQAGRLDGVMEVVLVGQTLANSVGFSEVLFHPRPIKSVPYHLIVAKQHPQAAEILAAFNQGLAILQANGRIEEILGY